MVIYMTDENKVPKVDGNTRRPPSKFITWCFTSYSVDKVDKDRLDDNDDIRAIVYQLEQCPETKRQHFQGTLQFHDSVSLNKAKKILGDEKIHLEPCRSLEKAIAYCSKSETRIDGPWGHGEFKKPGQRSDLNKLAKMVREGMSNYEIAFSVPESFMKFHKNIDALRNALLKERLNWRPELHILIGPPGAGKTSSIWVMEQDKKIYNKPDNSIWWPGYCGQDIIIINEFEGQLSLDFMNNMIDYYPFKVQVKGGYVEFTSKKIYITSNVPLEKWWPGKDIESFKRRITTIRTL